MATVGDRLPDATLWIAPRETVSLAALPREGPVLLVFYLFDWSAT